MLKEMAMMSLAAALVLGTVPAMAQSGPSSGAGSGSSSTGTGSGPDTGVGWSLVWELANQKDQRAELITKFPIRLLLLTGDVFGDFL